MAGRVYCRTTISILRGFSHHVLLLLVIKVEMILILGGIQGHRTVSNFLSTSHTIAYTSLSGKGRRLFIIRDASLFV